MNKKILFSISLIVIILLVAIFASVVAPNDPLENNICKRFLSFDKDYPLGTDNLGRCVLSRIVFGARNTLQIAFIVILISAFLGISIGCIAGYSEGIIDRILLNIFDVFMAFPPFVYVMVLIGLLGSGKLNLILSISISTWVISTKVVRTKVKVEKQKLYVKNAKVCGTSDLKIVLKHIIPNIIVPMIVFFSLQMGDIILYISGFSFLGLGMPADIPEWGMMINEAKKTIYSSPWLMVYPGVCIFLTVLSFNTLAEGIREEFGE